MEVLFRAARRGVRPCILSGDVHVSAVFGITDDRHRVWQLTSSAVTYHVPRALGWALRFGAADDGETPEGYGFSRLALYTGTLLRPHRGGSRCGRGMVQAVRQADRRGTEPGAGQASGAAQPLGRQDQIVLTRTSRGCRRCATGHGGTPRLAATHDSPRGTRRLHIFLVRRCPSGLRCIRQMRKGVTTWCVRGCPWTRLAGVVCPLFPDMAALSSSRRSVGHTARIPGSASSGAGRIPPVQRLRRIGFLGGARPHQVPQLA